MSDHAGSEPRPDWSKCLQRLRDPQGRENVWVPEHEALAFAAHYFEMVAERDALKERNERLTKALAAYRSALRCGEPETEQLRSVGDAALAAESGEGDRG